MRVSPKKLVVNLKYAELKGNVLDVSLDDAGVIYNLIKLKDPNDVKVDDKLDENYDSAALFFSLSSLNKTDSKSLLVNLYNLLNDEGEIYIWDRAKAKNELVRDRVLAKLDDKVTKEFNIMNLNPFYEFSIEKVENLIDGLFIVSEKLLWDNVIYLKLIKLKK